MAGLIKDANVEAAATAFSAQAAHFDADDRANSILLWMRDRIRSQLLQHLGRNSNILELNCGTGLDAAWLADLGHKVLATDVAEGMLQELRHKLGQNEITDRIEVRRLSYLQLRELGDDLDGKFDHVFSNFGGLNCVPDLSKMFLEVSRLLRPGGKVTLVVMPRFCLWELAEVLRGNFDLAFRRFHRGGSKAVIDGRVFTTWYFSPRYISRGFGSGFSTVELSGLCSVAPLPHLSSLAERFPGITSLLQQIDHAISRLPGVSWISDHFAMTLEKRITDCGQGFLRSHRYRGTS